MGTAPIQQLTKQNSSEEVPKSRYVCKKWRDSILKPKLSNMTELLNTNQHKFVPVQIFFKVEFSNKFNPYNYVIESCQIKFLWQNFRPSHCLIFFTNYIMKEVTTCLPDTIPACQIRYLPADWSAGQ